MDRVRIYSWVYSPKDFFEETQEYDFRGTKITIEDGVVSCVSDCEDVSLDELWEYISSVFYARQLVLGRSVKLEKQLCSNEEICYDGQRNVTINLCEGVVCSDQYEIKLIRNGKVIFSDKEERERLERELSSLIYKHRNDDRVKEIIKELQLAAENKREALMHLFKIHEILRDKKTLLCKCNPGLRNKWDNFKKLCNDSSLDISRHKNPKYIGQFRKVTSEEIKKAWNTITEIVLAYLRYLGDKQGS